MRKIVIMVLSLLVLVGCDGPPMSIEAQIKKTTPEISIIGAPDKKIKSERGSYEWAGSAAMVDFAGPEGFLNSQTLVQVKPTDKLLLNIPTKVKSVSLDDITLEVSPKSGKTLEKAAYKKLESGKWEVRLALEPGQYMYTLKTKYRKNMDELYFVEYIFGVEIKND
ncbi:hypothetical protein [Listeria booriae]|uniref:hypothetical protein n=1 Tax=Listeria booriae TaxID=1552123 RepID=UPI001626B06B|nr:hypothetical protein [Listeria booriae]MBC1800252.1 hypothetical protein [Listeria booriae]